MGIGKCAVWMKMLRFFLLFWVYKVTWKDVQTLGDRYGLIIIVWSYLIGFLIMLLTKVYVVDYTASDIENTVHFFLYKIFLDLQVVMVIYLLFFSSSSYSSFFFFFFFVFFCNLICISFHSDGSCFTILLWHFPNLLKDVMHPTSTSFLKICFLIWDIGILHSS